MVSKYKTHYPGDCWQAASSSLPVILVKVCINATHASLRWKYTTGPNGSNDFNLYIIFFFLALYPFNSLFSAQMKEVKPLTCLPVPLSAAFNVSGKFQRGQTKINTKHRVPEVAGTAQHHPCQTKGVYLISHQMRSSLGSLLTRVRSLHCRPLWDVVPQYYCFFTMEKYIRVGKV